MTNNNYSFYICNGGCQDNLSLENAVTLFKEAFKKNTTGSYMALGVQKGARCCDIVNNLGIDNSLKISNDHKYCFEDDNLIQINLINIMKETFNLN